MCVAQCWCDHSVWTKFSFFPQEVIVETICSLPGYECCMCKAWMCVIVCLCAWLWWTSYLKYATKQNITSLVPPPVLNTNDNDTFWWVKNQITSFAHIPKLHSTNLRWCFQDCVWIWDWNSVSNLRGINLEYYTHCRLMMYGSIIRRREKMGVKEFVQFDLFWHLQPSLSVYSIIFCSNLKVMYFVWCTWMLWYHMTYTNHPIWCEMVLGNLAQ